MNIYIGIISSDGTFKIKTYNKSLSFFKAPVMVSCDKREIIIACEELGLVYED